MSFVSAVVVLSILVACHLTIGGNGSRIFVSSITGQDHEDCGDENENCKTIYYALHKETSSSVELILDCSQTKHVVFHVSSAINVIQFDTLLLTKINKSCLNPEVTRADDQNDIAAVFAIHTNLPSIFIDSINFVNTGIFWINAIQQCRGDQANIVVSNSVVEISSKKLPLSETGLIQWKDQLEQVQCNAIVINMTNIHFKAVRQYSMFVDFQLAGQKNVIIRIINTTMRNAEVSFPKTEIPPKGSDGIVPGETNVLYFDHVLFINSYINITGSSFIKTVTMTNIWFKDLILGKKLSPLRFVGPSSKQPLSHSNLIISNLTVEGQNRKNIGRALYLYNVSSRIANVTLQGCKTNYALLFRGGHHVIRNLKFLNGVSAGTLFFYNFADDKKNTSVLLQDCFVYNNSFTVGFKRPLNKAEKYPRDSVLHWIIDRCTFTSNRVKDNLIRFNDARITLKHLTAHDNKMNKSQIQFRLTERKIPSLVEINGYSDPVHIDNVNIAVPSSLDVPALVLSLPKMISTVHVNEVRIYCTHPSTILSVSKLLDSVDTTDDTNTYIYGCRYCSKDKYHYQEGIGEVTLLRTLDKINNTESSINLRQCRSCPEGGLCKQHPVKSAGNLFGYQRSDEDVQFVACPIWYCCSNSAKPCSSINTCNYNRTGVLCGTCIDDHQEDYFNTMCIPKRDCQDTKVFWSIEIIYVLILTLFFCYMSDMAYYIKAYLYAIVERLQRKKDEKVDSSQIDDLKIHRYDMEQAPGSFSVFIKTATNFYQMKSLLTIELGVVEKSARYVTISMAISNLFNLDAANEFLSGYCPLYSLDPVQKKLIRGFAFIGVSMLLLTVAVCGLKVGQFFWKKFKSMKKKKSTDNKEKKDAEHKISLRLMHRVGLCSIRIAMFTYKNMASFVLAYLHCIELKGKQVLFIHGDMDCYSPKQHLAMVFCVLWIFPFPIGLTWAYQAFQRAEINFNQFVVYTMCPILSVSKWILDRFQSQKKRKYYVPTVYGNTLMYYTWAMLEQPYKKNTSSYWETYNLYQRLIVACVVTFIADNLDRMLLALPIIIVSATIYLTVQPHKESLGLIKLLEVTSFFSISFFVCANIFRSFFHVLMDGESDRRFDQMFEVFSVVEVVANPFTFVLMYALCVFVGKKLAKF